MRKYKKRLFLDRPKRTICISGGDCKEWFFFSQCWTRPLAIAPGNAWVICRGSGKSPPKGSFAQGSRKKGALSITHILSYFFICCYALKKRVPYIHSKRKLCLLRSNYWLLSKIRPFFALTWLFIIDLLLRLEVVSPTLKMGIFHWVV